MTKGTTPRAMDNPDAELACGAAVTVALKESLLPVWRDLRANAKNVADGTHSWATHRPQGADGVHVTERSKLAKALVCCDKDKLTATGP